MKINIIFEKKSDVIEGNQVMFMAFMFDICTVDNR